MLVQASAFGSWLQRLHHVFMFFLCMSLFSNFLFLFCDPMYLINLI